MESFLKYRGKGHKRDQLEINPRCELIRPTNHQNWRGRVATAGFDGWNCAGYDRVAARRGKAGKHSVSLALSLRQATNTDFQPGPDNRHLIKATTSNYLLTNAFLLWRCSRKMLNFWIWLILFFVFVFVKFFQHKFLQITSTACWTLFTLCSSNILLPESRSQLCYFCYF